MKKKNFIDLFFETYPKARQISLIILIIAISTTVIIRDDKWKAGLLALFGVTLLFVIFDFYKTLKTRLEGIDSRLDDINNGIKNNNKNIVELGEKVNNVAPPTYPYFAKALIDIREILNERARSNGEVSIKILAVSSQFSWKNIVEDTVIEILTTHKPKPKIFIEMVLVSPKTLHNWGQQRLEILADNTLKCIEIFKKNQKTEFSNGHLKLDFWEYDNIPQWHGVLIDDDIFFMGRCYWEENNGKYYLKVGEKEYRQFSINDDFQGKDRVNLFNHWFNAYKVRSQKAMLPK
ncbi:MAG: hypothetical protein U0Y10_11200 [Spirosomataceae bacterium]